MESFTTIRSDDSQQRHLKSLKTGADKIIQREFFYQLERELEKVDCVVAWFEFSSSIVKVNSFFLRKEVEVKTRFKYLSDRRRLLRGHTDDINAALVLLNRDVVKLQVF